MGMAFSEWWNESQPMRYVPIQWASGATGNSAFIRKPNTIYPHPINHGQAELGRNTVSLTGDNIVSVFLLSPR